MEGKGQGILPCTDINIFCNICRYNYGFQALYDSKTCVHIVRFMCVFEILFFFLKWKNFIQVFFDWNSNFVWSLSRRRLSNEIAYLRFPYWVDLLSYESKCGNSKVIFWSFKQILFCNIWGPPIELAHFRAPIKVNVAIFRWVGHTDTHLHVGHLYIRIKPLAPYHFKKNYDCKIVKRKLERLTYHFVLHYSMRLTGCWGLGDWIFQG